MWDLGLYIQAIESVVQRSCLSLPESGRSSNCLEAWLKVPDRLAFYDYLGHNPAKGGLFRVGPLVNGGVQHAW